MNLSVDGSLLTNIIQMQAQINIEVPAPKYLVSVVISNVQGLRIYKKYNSIIPVLRRGGLTTLTSS